MLKSFGKVASIIALVCLLLIIVGVAVFGFYTWYWFYDIGDLKLYDSEPIEQIVQSGEVSYILTDNGDCYMVGGYDGLVGGRNYWNTESRPCESLGIHCSPVYMMSDVVKIFSDEYLPAILLTKDGTAYETDSGEAKKIMDNVLFIDKINTFENYYIIDTAHRLWYLEGDNQPEQLFEGVTMVSSFYGRAFVLLDTGWFGEIYREEKGYAFVPLFENVISFDVKRTRYILGVEDGLSPKPEEKIPPVINVLTEDGTLYAKGAYEIIKYSDSIKTTTIASDPCIIEEWMVVEQDVKNFSLSERGTLLLKDNGEIIYFCVVQGKDDEVPYEFTKLLLNYNDVISIQAMDSQLLIQTKERYYMYGNIFDNEFINEYGRTVFDDNPVIVQLP